MAEGNLNFFHPKGWPHMGESIRDGHCRTGGAVFKIGLKDANMKSALTILNTHKMDRKGSFHIGDTALDLNI